MSAMKPRLMQPVLPQSLETKQASHADIDEYGQPIKVRKKPGRKPKSTPPTLLGEQNRAAQRAFRERRENRLRDLENTIHTLREQRDRAIKELEQQKKADDATKAKNWYLTGLALTLHFICMYNNVPIPIHSPYLSKEDQNEIAKVSSYAVQAYLDVVRRNDARLNLTTALDFSNYPEGPSSPSPEHTLTQWSTARTRNQNLPLVETKSNEPMAPELNKQIANFPYLDDSKKDEDKEKDEREEDEERGEEEKGKIKPVLSGVGLIQWIRLCLRVQTLLNEIKRSRIGLQPTLLQLVVPHDPRIDLTTMAHVRDRLIIFSDIVDYDEYFEILLNKGVYKGGDPTVRESYDLP
ncbi:hypothetical protein DFQ28_011294, partial [Apophysomyces sp. BC1034]